MAENYVLLETIELSQVAASVTFDNLPTSGYTDLKIVVSARNTTATTVGNVGLNMRINGATTGYTGKQLYGGGGTSVGSINRNNTNIGTITSANDTANCFNNAEIFIPDYTGSNPKIHSVDSISASNANAELDFVAKMQSTTSPVTSVTFICDTDSFAAGSTFSIYAVAALGTTPVTAPFATGGNIVANDGTYWYHAFLSSGTFTPFKALSCDYLVIAGGGAGGSSPNGQHGGGGGGAGGYLSSVGSSGGGASAGSVLSLTAQSYAVSVGAGGTTNANGTNTTFAGITATGGGTGGLSGTGAGATGGSGGGGSSSSSPGAGGSATASPVQGFAGGSGQGTNNYACGGGGGAGAVGFAGGIGAPNESDGGAGKNTLSAWASATNTGVSGYYAGGGGGGYGQFGAFNGSGGGGGGLGGGGNGTTFTNGAVATAGTANTGSGGGGSKESGFFTNSAVGGNGGSGIVIVRYAMV